MSKVNTGQASSTLIPKYIGSDFDKVVAVADNIEQVVIVGDNIEDVGTVADNIAYVKEVAEDLHGMPVTMYTGETPPVLNPMPEGVMWYCTTDGRTYVWYTDADSGQWVESAPQSAIKDEATNIFFHSTHSNVNPAYRSATLYSAPAPEAEISVAHNALNTPVVQAQFIREEALWVDVSVKSAQGIVTLMGYSSGNSQLKAEIISWKNGAEGTSLGASQWVTLPSQPSVVSLPVTLANIDVLDAGDSYVVRLTSQMNAGGNAVSTILVDGNTSSRFGIIFNTNLIGLNDGIRDGVITSAPTENAVYDALQLKVGKSQLAQSGELIPVADWADVPAYSDPELGGLDGPLNAQAKALTARSELLLTDVREALRRSYAEAGYNLVDGSFEAGGTLVNANDVLLQERTGKAFSGPAGTVAAGTNPASGGFVDKSGGLLRHELATSNGATKVGTSDGGSVQDFIDAQYTTVAELATGKFQVGQYVRLTDRAMGLFLLQSGGLINGRNILDAGNGNTAVLQQEQYSRKESFGVTASESTSALTAYLNRNTGGLGTMINSVVAVSPLYTHIAGDGDGNPITLSGVAGLSYTYTVGEFNDHAHRKLENQRIVGDGTQTLYLHDGGSYAEFVGNTFDTGLNGLVIRDAYTCSGHKNYYKGNVNGLVLDNTSSFTEYEIYARRNTTAAVRIQGATNEDVNLIGGAIEGNRGSAIKVDAGVGSQFRLNIQNVYFELDGDTFDGATTPSIDIPLINEAVHTRFNGGKLSYNSVAGWVSGDYNFGYNVMFSGTKVSGVLNSKLMKFADGCRLDDATLNNGDEPAFVADWDSSVKFTSGFGAVRGYVFSCSVIGKATTKSPIANTTKTAHPYITLLGDGPVISEDATLDYGDGSWTKAVFAASAGSYSSNSVYIGNTVSGVNKQRIYSFLVRSNIDTTVEFLESQTGVAIRSTHQLKAGVVYKMVCIANKVIAGTQRLAMFPTVDNAPVISVLCLRQSQFNDATVTRASALVSQIVRGVL